MPVMGIFRDFSNHVYAAEFESQSGSGHVLSYLNFRSPDHHNDGRNISLRHLGDSSCGSFSLWSFV